MLRSTLSIPQTRALMPRPQLLLQYKGALLTASTVCRFLKCVACANLLYANVKENTCTMFDAFVLRDNVEQTEARGRKRRALSEEGKHACFVAMTRVFCCFFPFGRVS